MQLTEDMILDAVDNIKNREEYKALSEYNRALTSLYMTQLARDLRIKLND
jgi:DNA-binding MltR family transcriptional regulator